MSTRGVFIVRKNNEEKGIYISTDAYPAYAGRKILEMIKELDMEKVNERMVVDSFTDSTRMSFEAFVSVAREGWIARFENAASFIQDSLYCEHAYVVDLDEGTLEYYEGFQTTPDPGNRYGMEKNESGHYPCKLAKTFALSEVLARPTDDLVEEMEESCCFGEEEETGFSCEEVLLNISDIQASLGGCIAAVSAAMKDDTDYSALLLDNLSAIQRNVTHIMGMLA